MKILHYCVGNSDLNLLSDYDPAKSQKRFKDYYSTTKILYQNIFCNEDKLIIKEHDDFNYKKYISISDNCENFLFKNSAGEDRSLDMADINIIYFPIFNALLKKLTEKKNNILRHINRIFLYATEQDLDSLIKNSKNIADAYDNKEKDTLYVAQILKKYIESLPEVNPEIEIEIINIDKEPFGYNEMAQFFEVFITKNERTISRVSENIITLSSGTPAMYTTLAFLMKKYSACYYYIPLGAEKAKEIDYYLKINQDYYQTLIFQAIDSYDYASAIALLKESPFRFSQKSVIDILELQNERLKFNFARMNDILCEKIEEQKYLLFQKYFQVIREFDIGNSEKYKFNEIMEQIEICIKKKDYISLLSFVYTIMENFAEYLINQNPLIKERLPLPFNKKDKYSVFKKLIFENKDISKYLKEKHNITVEDYNAFGMTKRIIDATLEKLYEADEYKEKIENYFLLCNKLQNLFETRNRFVHSFVTVFEFPYESPEKLLSDLKDIFLLFNVYNDKYPTYDFINKSIKKMLSK